MKNPTNATKPAKKTGNKATAARPARNRAPKPVPKPKTELKKMYVPAVHLNGLTYQESVSGKLVPNVVNPYDLKLCKSKAAALARAEELASGYKRSDHAHATTVCYSLEA